MRTEWRVLLPVGAFYVVAAPIYGYFTAWKEPIGVVGLLLSGVLVGVMVAYFYLVSRRIDPRPEDIGNAEVASGAGEMGFFPDSSIWPLWVALTLGVMVLGPIFGWWLTFLGMGMGIWSVSGLTYQYYRGDYRH